MLKTPAHFIPASDRTDITDFSTAATIRMLFSGNELCVSNDGVRVSESERAADDIIIGTFAGKLVIATVAARDKDPVTGQSLRWPAQPVWRHER